MANPNRNRESYYTESYKQKQAEKTDRLFGKILEHTKVCEKCSNEFIFKGRKNTRSFEKARFCSRSCANHRGVGLEWQETHKSRTLTHYKKICFTEWEQKCAVCGFDKIISVHHIDHNHNNNDVKNLIPLCPNHHQMVHTNEYGDEMELIIAEILKTKNGGLAELV